MSSICSSTDLSNSRRCMAFEPVNVHKPSPSPLSSQALCLGPSHLRAPVVGSRATDQRRIQILPVRIVAFDQVFLPIAGPAFQ